MVSWCLVPLKRPFVKDGNYNNKWGNCKERCKPTPKWLNRFAGCVSSHFPPHKYCKTNIKIFCFQLLNKSKRALDFKKKNLPNIFFTLLHWIFPNSKVGPKKYSENFFFFFLFQAQAGNTMESLLTMAKACKISILALQNQDHFSNCSKTFYLILLTKSKIHSRNSDACLVIISTLNTSCHRLLS